jgi:hypothetical protein
MGTVTQHIENKQLTKTYPAQDTERRQNPPGVANVCLLLGPAVEPTRVALALRQPPAQQVLVHVVEPFADRQRADAAEDLAGMRLCSRYCPETTVEIATTARHIQHRELYVNISTWDIILGTIPRDIFNRLGYINSPRI